MASQKLYFIRCLLAPRCWPQEFIQIDDSRIKSEGGEKFPTCFDNTADKSQMVVTNILRCIQLLYHLPFQNHYVFLVSCGQHGAHMGPVSPRRAPCRPHEPCYQGLLRYIDTHNVFDVPCALKWLRWLNVGDDAYLLNANGGLCNIDATLFLR